MEIRTLNREISVLVPHTANRRRVTLLAGEKVVILGHEDPHVIFARLSDRERAGRDKFILESGEFDEATA